MVNRTLKNPFFIAVIICAFIFYSGLFKITDKNIITSLIPDNQISEISGKLLSSPMKTSSGKYYSAKLKVYSVVSKDNIVSTASGITNVFLPANMVEAYYPGKIFTKSQLTGNYIFESGGEYFFSGKYGDKGIYVNNCKCSNWKKNIWGRIDFFRALCRLQFKRMMYGWGKAGGLLLALLCGSREYTEEAVRNAFKNAGLSHILALSGMHLSMFSSIAIFAGKKIKRIRITYLTRITVLILFVWFAGFSPSLLRAFICTFVSILVLISGNKEMDMIIILSISFLIQCIISSADIYNTGFILSYGALFGILLLRNSLKKITNLFFPVKISSSLSASIAAQAFTAPISLKLFGSFAPAGIFASLLVSPLITFFIYTGMSLIFISSIFSLFIEPSGIFMNFQYTVIKFVVEIFSRLPGININ